MDGREIQRIRHALGESVEQFGRRFFRGGRAVEDWEQNRRTPHPLVVEELERIRGRLERFSP